MAVAVQLCGADIGMPKRAVGLLNVDGLHHLFLEQFSQCSEVDIAVRSIVGLDRLPVKKDRKPTNIDYRPRGILKREWIHKHQGAVFACIMILFNWDDKPDRLPEFVAYYEQVKAALKGRNTRVMVVLFSYNQDGITPIVASSDEINALRKKLDIDSRYIFALGKVNEFVNACRALARAANDLCSEYYKVEAKRVKKYKGDSTKAQPPHIQASHCFKTGFMYECARDVVHAMKYYIQAYSAAQQVATDWYTPLEVRSVGQCIAEKIITIMLPTERDVNRITEFFAGHMRWFTQMAPPAAVPNILNSAQAIPQFPPSMAQGRTGAQLTDVLFYGIGLSAQYETMAHKLRGILAVSSAPTPKLSEISPASLFLHSYYAVQGHRNTLSKLQDAFGWLHQKYAPIISELRAAQVSDYEFVGKPSIPSSGPFAPEAGEDWESKRSELVLLRVLLDEQQDSIPRLHCLLEKASECYRPEVSCRIRQLIKYETATVSLKSGQVESASAFLDLCVLPMIEEKWVSVVKDIEQHVSSMAGQASTQWAAYRNSRNGNIEGMGSPKRSSIVIRNSISGFADLTESTEEQKLETLEENKLQAEVSEVSSAQEELPAINEEVHPPPDTPDTLGTSTYEERDEKSEIVEDASERDKQELPVDSGDFIDEKESLPGSPPGSPRNDPVPPLPTPLSFGASSPPTHSHVHNLSSGISITLHHDGPALLNERHKATIVLRADKAKPEGSFSIPAIEDISIANGAESKVSDGPSTPSNKIFTHRVPPLQPGSSFELSIYMSCRRAGRHWIPLNYLTGDSNEFQAFVYFEIWVVYPFDLTFSLSDTVEWKLPNGQPSFTYVPSNSTSKFTVKTNFIGKAEDKGNELGVVKHTSLQTFAGDGTDTPQRAFKSRNPINLTCKLSVTTPFAIWIHKVDLTPMDGARVIQSPVLSEFEIVQPGEEQQSVFVVASTTFSDTFHIGILRCTASRTKDGERIDFDIPIPSIPLREFPIQVQVECPTICTFLEPFTLKLHLTNSTRLMQSITLRAQDSRVFFWGGRTYFNDDILPRSSATICHTLVPNTTGQHSLPSIEIKTKSGELVVSPQEALTVFVRPGNKQ